MSSLEATFGATFIGVIFAAVLYGFTCIQSWYYFTRYPLDPWHNKLVVMATFITETAHQIVITQEIYTYLVSYFGDFEKLGTVIWTSMGEVFFNALTTFFVQCFMAMRIWKLSNKDVFMTCSALLLVSAQFSLTFAFGIESTRLKTFSQIKRLGTLSTSVNAIAVAGDTFITVMLCYLLQKSRTGFRRSDTIIKKSMLFSINTGLLTSVCAIASLISYFAWPGTFIFVAFYFCSGRLYCNSLLATLNSRKGLQSQSNTEEMSLSFQGPDRNRGRHITSQSKHVPTNISIKIDTTREFAQDEQQSSLNGDIKDTAVV